MTPREQLIRSITSSKTAGVRTSVAALRARAEQRVLAAEIEVIRRWICQHLEEHRYWELVREALR